MTLISPNLPAVSEDTHSTRGETLLHGRFKDVSVVTIGRKGNLFTKY